MSLGLDQQSGYATIAPEHVYPVHRSNRALARNANVFVWWPSSSAKVIACFNADITPITAKTLLRWIGMPIAPHAGDVEAVVIRRVHLDHQDICLYVPRPLECLGSSDMIGPGIYGCFVQGDIPHAPVRALPIWPSNNIQTLEEMETLELEILDEEHHDVEDWPELREIIIKNRSVPEQFCEQITIPRDKCVLTAASNDSSTPEAVVSVHWIFPWHRCRENLNQTLGVPREVVLTPQLGYSPANLLPMRADVYKLWMANEISVDIDDGYRIHTFTEAAYCKMKDLGGKLALESPNAEWTPFLREHLLQTVLLRVNGGNIMEDFGLNGWNTKLAQLAQGNEEDPVWQEPIGQDAWRLLHLDGPSVSQGSHVPVKGKQDPDPGEEDTEGEK